MKNSLYLSAYEDGTDRVFGNVSIQNSDAGELPRREHTTFRTWQKFEINFECGINIMVCGHFLQFYI